MRTQVAKLALLFVALSLPAGRAAADEQTCITCHRRRMTRRLRAPLAILEDVHGTHGVFCADCHGGRPDVLSMEAHDPGSGFTSGDHGFAQVTMCGRCHDGSVEGLDDVLSRYRAGSHMRAVTDGLPGARCSDCHDNHGIRPPDDPESPVSFENVPNTCGSCHAENPRIAHDQLQQYELSVHGRAHAAGNRDAPTCAVCHDPHENNAGLSAVAQCGECHEDIRAAFDRGPHSEAFQSYGFLDCVECHGSHEVRSADATLLSGRSAACNRFHRRGQEPFERMRQIAAVVRDADRRRRALERIDERRQAFSAAMHALDLDALREAAAALPPVAEEPEAPSSARARMRSFMRWDILAYTLGAVLLAVLALAIGVWRWRKKR